MSNVSNERKRRINPVGNRELNLTDKEWRNTKIVSAIAGIAAATVAVATIAHTAESLNNSSETSQENYTDIATPEDDFDPSR